MSSALGWLAVVLAGLGGPNPPKVEGLGITYQFKMVEITGLDWRVARGHGLRPVASRGGVTVWTAPRDFFRSLPEGAVKETVAAPRLSTHEQAPAHVTMRQSQPFVTQASWRGNDLPPRETTEQIREGMAATIRGRRLDQGVLAYLVIEDTDIRAVHTLGLPKTDPACPKAVATSACTEMPGCPFVQKTLTAAAAICPATRKSCQGCDQACTSAGETKSHDAAVTQTSCLTVADHECCAGEWSETACSAGEKPTCCATSGQADTSKCCADSKTAASDKPAQLRIPEIGRGEIAGEWLIPRDELLLVGFGPHTVADKDGKAVVRERLAVITAEDISLPTAMNGDEEAAPPFPTTRVARPTAATASALATPGMPMPAMPSRSLPQGVHADGTTADLPPLPEETLAEQPADGSTEPHPSPQSKRPRPEAEPASAPAHAPKPTAGTDAKTTKASFAFPRGLFRPAGLPTIGLPNLQFMMPLKPFELKLPLNQKLQLELIGKIVPDTDSATEGEGGN